MVGEEKQQIVLSNREVKNLFPAPYLPPYPVYSDFAEGDNGFSIGLLGALFFREAYPAEGGPDTGYQFLQAEGFGHVVVRSNFKPYHPVQFFGPCGEHDDVEQRMRCTDPAVQMAILLPWSATASTVTAAW